MKNHKIFIDLLNLYAHNDQLRTYKITFQKQLNELQQQLEKCEVLLFENKIKEIEMKKALEEK
jgi:hypothetical protein